MPSAANRPLSPHLSVYRWQYTMALSILHRFTGVVLSIGSVALVGCLLALASGPQWGGNLEGFFGLRIVRLAALGWTYCLFYHFANGVRHLVWDIGRGFEPGHARLSGWFVFLASLAATGAYWWWGPFEGRIL
ncbi:MAG: succinate dehydrogenase, cytochrome b556 subunit [Gammaproteobacteria bacterium]|nr:succinate dehydrogenase, cytochrome b556 subunit [Chromatiales bacterium]MYA30439.1 succinate dehydrogenase, cytochrome b556 subunit [Gammaproteobacteria bacterium]MYE49432.1 succinate dehydrogenase, cytochrome b556 subunit [Gammaproteobacteria bacterium]MYF68199.1 succinate dehydrogenase, cytochrome b556 subunit [Gammaproteobacteria bacterium]MYK37467.1 succinate dehydrogenase, cytochrome b556 subunit [Gammaproteobacteria bacterium]